MGLLDKLKEGAEQAKDLAAAAAERAKDEAKELNLKRQLGNEHQALGEKAYTLVEQGAISHPDLDPHLTKIRALTAELEGLRTEQPSEPEEPGGPEAPAAPAAGQAPASDASTADAPESPPDPPQAAS